MKAFDLIVHDPRARMPIFALAVIALLAAMWAGLLRMGWGFPQLVTGIAMLHGPLLVCGFLGTLIPLERAVALQKPWGYIAPVFNAVGAIVLLATPNIFFGALLMTIGSLGMVAIFYVIVRRQPALFTYTMGLGAVAWFIGNILWLAGFGFVTVTLWWAAFLILTIVGERLELSRLMRLSKRTEQLFIGAVALFLLGVIIDLLEAALFAQVGLFIGSRVAGLGMIAMALWLLRYDIARRTVKQSGLTRFIAWCLLLGYVWLGIGGILRILMAGAFAGPIYDALLHSVFVGFVFSMIFGHAPIILPAVLARHVPYSPLMYVPLILLNLSLILRVTGDLWFGLYVRQWGGMLNVISILLFLFLMARAVLSTLRAKNAPRMAA
jgi:hypothetical protein